MKTNHHLVYATRLRGVATAARSALPDSEETKALKATALALEATVRVGADRSTAMLIPRARRDVTALAAASSDALALAFRDDAREALNRLAGMVKRNDPDPEFAG